MKSNIDNYKNAVLYFLSTMICIVGMTPGMSMLVHAMFFRHFWLHWGN